MKAKHTKRCGRCRVYKPEDRFYKSKPRPDGLCSWCKQCSKEYERIRRANPKRMKQRNASKRELRYSKQRLVVKYKATQGCTRCSENDPRCLHLHHTVPEDKLGNISEMICRGRPWEVIVAEMAKCEVLCANCHFKEHIHPQP